MIQRMIAIGLGGLVTFGLLILFDGGNRIITDRNAAYVVAIVVGGIANFIWPLIIARRAAQRIKDRRDAEIQAEVERQGARQQQPH